MFTVARVVNSVHELVEHFFRHESGRLVALLTRSLGIGRLDLIEDVVQTSLMQALQTWALRGTPDDPAGWLYQTARNRAIDALRREQNHDRILLNIANDLVAHEHIPFEPCFDEEIGDEPLRLLFLCCHESIPIESRVALALRIVCGFSTAEIARGLLTTEMNVQKRIVRAKERLREESNAWESPGLEPLRNRLDAVLATIYLLFNEGYNSAHEAESIRRDLCEEAIRLARMLATHPLGDHPSVHALLALLGFHAARFDARRPASGMIVLLGEQDRTTWDWRLIRESMNWMLRSAVGDSLSRYHVEAAIAWEHCRAEAFVETDWNQIITLYQTLQYVAPSPIHLLNQAVAEAHFHGPEVALATLAAIPEKDVPGNYPAWPAIVGELQFRAGNLVAAEKAWSNALALGPAPSDRNLILRKLAECQVLHAN